MEDTFLSGLNVVLIDNDLAILRVLKSILEDMGIDAHQFDNPLKGIEWIEGHGADIVISDICMPQCDGFEVLRRVKLHDANIDLIFITAHGEMETAIKALREGASDFCEKPLTIPILRAALERTHRYRLLARQKQLLTNEVDALRGELSRTVHRNVMIGQSDGLKRVAQEIVDVAASSATVLILGESGTGKELVALAIHKASARKDKLFLTLNCPSIPEELFESEMFGHRKGSFTGAVESRGGGMSRRPGAGRSFWTR